ncbi:MAG: amino acid ABC transporter permease [Lachnospiraceae bacterium]|jgi:polar amino acid transport system permease protein|nr:amino acid ABC transporter permease [Lachnospiraceae bacterium]
MDTDFIVQSIPIYGEAALLTLWSGVAGIILSLAVGFVCALVQYYKIPIAKWVVAGYIELSRNTPLLVQLFFLYFGLPKLGIVLSGEVCAVTGLAFLGGSYMAEAIRCGLEAVAPIQIESGLSLGLSNAQIMRYIVSPQALSVATPALLANAVFLIKETSMFSAIAVKDLMFVANEQLGNVYKTEEIFLLLICFYLIILLPITIATGIIERRMRHAEFGA